jgi:cholesterol transport system auxiliary component
MKNKYYYHQWIMEPGDMITHLFVRDLRASNIARAILISESSYATHQLSGMVDEFYEQDHENGWNAVLSITITLTEKKEIDVTKRILFQKNYKTLYPCKQKNPKGSAMAMSMAMSEISKKIISDIYDVLLNGKESN